MRPDRVELVKQYTDAELSDLRDTKIVVGIPAHNSEHRVGRVIKNLVAQATAQKLKTEIIVCANGCSDNTGNAAKQALRRINNCGISVTGHVIEKDEPGEPLAINSIVESAGTPENIIIVNDDVFPTKKTLGQLAMSLLDNEELGAIGVVPTTLCPKKNYTLPVRMGRYYLTGSGENIIVGRMYGFKPRLIGPFADIISEDCFLTLRALEQSAGFGILRDGTSTVHYRVATSIDELRRQMFMYSLGTAQFNRLYPQMNENFGYVFGDTAVSRSLFAKLCRRLQTDGDLNLMEKLYTIFLIKTQREKAIKYDQKHLPNSSKRPRITSTV